VRFLLVLVMLAGCGLQPAFPLAPAASADLAAQAVEGEVLVRLAAGATLPQGWSTLRVLSGLDASLVRVPRTLTLKQAVDRLQRLSGVIWAEPNWRVDLVEDGAPPVMSLPAFSENATPPDLWHLQRVQARDAWNTTKGRGVTVAVIDTGIDATHPAFLGRVLSGYDAIDRDSDPRDDNGHGTHVAGIIAAQAPDLSLLGLAPESRIMPVRVLGDRGGSAESVATGIQWAVARGAHVLNLSLGSPMRSRLIEDAVKTALQRGVVVVAAMGNAGDRGNPRIYPASLPGVIAVGATDLVDRRTSWSCFGRWQALAAPGYGIWSTFPTYDCALVRLARENPSALPPENRIDTYASALSGTSQAAPVVAGVAALVRAMAPEMAPDKVASLLQDAARDLGAPGFDSYHGHGMVQAANALKLVRATKP